MTASVVLTSMVKIEQSPLSDRILVVRFSFAILLSVRNRCLAS